LSDMVEVLINRVRTEHTSNWIIVIPLLHLLKGTSEPFQPVLNQVNAQYEKCWVGLQGLKLEYVKNRRAMLDLMKAHAHLVEVDRLLARSWMYLMTLDELVECDSFIHAELLDILQLFTMKCPKEISNSTSTSVLKILEHIQLHLLEQRYSCLNEDYGIQCIQAACKLLEMICKRVSHAFTDIPVACMNLVAAVSGFTQTTQQTDTFSEKTCELLRYAKQTVRRWIGQTFQGRLINTSYQTAANFTREIEMWNNIVSIQFMSKDFTKEWRETFTQDFEGKYQKEDPLDQIQVYCSKVEELNVSKPFLVGSVEKCALQAVAAKCQLCLEDILKLHIMEEHDEGCETRVYSFEDLRELQNKLMLMSGKGDQGQREVNRFTEVFASVQRLACAFIDLFVAGNPLFRHWKAKVNCNSKEECIIMHLDLGSVVSVMIEGEVTEQLPEVCKKMESCLCFWKDFMDKQRSQHYFLNYYTAEQVVYLCHQLTQSNVATMEDQVLMMLSFIKPNCTTSDLRQAWHRLQYEVIKKVPEQNDDLDFQTFMEVSSMMENVSIEEPCLLFDDLTSQLGDAIGSKKLDVIWNAYMRNMNNFLPDSLDVRNLGYLLKILANSPSEHEGDSSQDERTQYIQRELPNGMATRRPNLIICPPEEILISCISIYMSSKGQPLPTYDEVLLCSAFTSYEEVELFLRRCLSAGYRGKKIYTMLYVDQLTYEVSYKVEQFFQHQSAQSRNDYRLVLVCSSNREHAYLPSAFSQFRLHLIPQEPIVSIQQYLVRHFTVPADISSAAAVFKDRQCVGVVSSERSGVGKSLYIKRMYENLKITKKPSQLKCIRLIEPRVDENVILQSLLNSPKKKLSVYHLDVTTMVKKGLHEFLFRLLILGYLMDSEGNMWKSSNKHLYVIEILRPGTSRNDRRAGAFMDVFPSVYCRPPKEVLELEMRIQEDPSLVEGDDPLMDDQEFQSEAYQRPYQYLQRFYNGINLDTFRYQGVEGTHVECLQMLFVYCGIVDPSWAELRNFAWFLNLQLRDCENSVFCDVSVTGDILFGFKKFVVDFMILMAKDFATPSLSISDQSPGRPQNDLSSANEEDLAPFRIRKRWESEPHPYIFFNDDHESMTFIGFHLHPNAQKRIDAIDPLTKRVIKQNIMTRELYEGLKLQRVPFNIDFDQLPRHEKIERLSRVLGIQSPSDPDETYELTTDNMLKILAIHMRFRCGIPVIIMGETGCGKTRLIKFLCEVHRGGIAPDNIKLVKVHGGTSSDMIYTKVREAEDMALRNKQNLEVLFFDEANTTEAISSIKEVLCDNTAMGQNLTDDTGLQIIAACNPYRKHTDIMIKRLESAGLGYRVRAEETDEKLGSIPLRQLVYRVHALPPSMIPLVWDFGQLNDHTEKMYIKQIVERVFQTHSIDSNCITTITDVLSASQMYMRTRQDECSFVSLRDVERCMQVFGWFYINHEMLLKELGEFESGKINDQHQRDTEITNPILWSLIMAVGVCYHACLEDKQKYRENICADLPETYSPMKVMQEISVIQDLFLSGVPLGETIARNNALKENVFMMVICIELRIPLFLVGKPGSSKSLSKTLVADGMQGQAAHSDLFKKLKQIHLVSFQCSPHSTPDGIINTFKQSARFQKDKNLSEYVSVVVLDEIGLAEDSQKMPLKTLHPLLEEGCIDDQPVPHKKVGFIGISNWALDPAKMNRGIFVSRSDPDERELIKTAEGICSSNPMILERVREYFQPFACAYLNICNEQGRGFFGLRDYYSLIKMIFAVAQASEQRKKPSAEQIVKAVLRNFSGKDNVDAVAVFTSRLNIKPKLENVSTIELVRENITAIGQDEECRYLLVLTKNYAALQILQHMFFSDLCQPEIIFGSSFPKDQEYTQICRNINRVKICMETGQTIVLLNLQNLYESLYDALNQYYVWLGGQKYVDLGLGTHRVKCRVHSDFRLIVIEEKDVVYKQFPIPLINRLEKHYLDINTILKSEQKDLAEKLVEWVACFIAAKSNHSIAPKACCYHPADAFIGYHSDTCASVVLQVTEQLNGQISDDSKRILDEAKLILLNCATPDAVVRLDCTSFSKVETEHLSRVYFEDQKHSSLADFILSQIQQAGPSHAFFTEVTTFSRLLTATETEQLQNIVQNIELLSLQQFDMENSFLKTIRYYLLLDNSDESLRKLWLEIFGDVKLLNVPYTSLDNNSEKTILVQNYIAVDSNVGCTMPFSWRIKDHLEELWVHAFQQEGHSLDQFEEFFWKIPLGGYISEATQEMQMEFFHRYLQDFISMTMKVTSVANLELLCGALTCGVNELKGSQEIHESEVISLPWVHAAYHRFKDRIQNLYRMISIEPQIAQRILDNTCAREGTELVLDVYTAVACIECLEPQALDEDGQSLAWLRRVKKLQVPIELVCCEESLRHYGEKSNRIVTHIQHGWRRIYSLALFVQHMLLGVEDVHSNLRPLVLDHTRRLAQVLEQDSDLKNKQPFEAVVTILKACKDEASQSIFRFGSQLCPVCMGDPQDPLSLPCDHIFCLTCIKQWLVLGQMLCPLCRLEVPDDFELKASETIQGLIHQNALFRKRCNAFFIDLVSTICFKDSTPPSMDIIQHLLSLLMVEARSLPQIRGQDRKFLTKALSPFDDSVDKNPVVRSVVLKLLLKYSFDDVKHYLQQHLTEVEQSNIIQETDKTELYSLYINSLEDSMYDRTQWHSVSEQQICLQEETRFLLEFLHSDSVSAHTASIEHLQQVARVRLCLDMAADLPFNRDSMYDRTQWHSVSEQQICLQEETRFLLEFLHSDSVSAHTASIEHLQQVARVRLCLDMAADLPFNRDSMYDRTQWHSVSEQQICLQEETRFLLEFLHSDSVSAHTASIEHLQQVARVRLCLDMAADLPFNRSSNDWYRVYLIRKICSLHGVDYVQKLLSQKEFKWLFPQEVLNMNQDDNKIDHYVACGLDYKTIRDAVAKAMRDCDMNEIQKAIEATGTRHLRIHLQSLVTFLYRNGNPNSDPKPEQRAGLEDFIRSTDIFVNDETKAFAKGLVNNHLHALRVQPQMSGRELLLVEVTVHMAAVLLCGNLPLLEPLQQLALSPNNMTASFIPTMPDDMLAVAQQAIKGPHGLKVQWYSCPNGHPCIVDMCGLPMEVVRCLECNAEIGGIDHKPVDGFQTMQIQADRTQSGHILGDAQRRDQPDMQDTKNMSPAPFALLRLLTHMCMLLGAQNNTQ
ncbi:E3 ubiquitin-protein ligase rnf213-alpha-like, partial [Sinocyclocheilus rhinocerous]|uniref:E3 ubiquitin-protein ligase rnf213-alpha-like n=1 Tax=Sinocyclocheilus rhinocerous TaxID=307959 RepID=UPI0007BA38C2